MKIDVVQADYLDPRHARDMGQLLEAYAADPMGGAAPLAAGVRDKLATELARRPHAFSLLCYVDDQPAGLVNCFEGFSTFRCKPLINIHDIVVAPGFRGLGLSQLMLARVEAIAQARGCCKLTLEVLEGNKAAQAAYAKFGFEAYALDPAMGKALFWQKNMANP
jgi:ribosomal protein S18 acetylase RimI-like enzyme